MRGEREWKEGSIDWRRGRERKTREIIEGGVTEEDMVFEGEIGGENERGMRENGFQEGIRVYLFYLCYKTYGQKSEIFLKI